MKTFTINPWLITIAVLIFGYIYLGDIRGFDGFVILILAFILGKQFEITEAVSELKGKFGEHGKQENN